MHLLIKIIGNIGDVRLLRQMKSGFNRNMVLKLLMTGIILLIIFSVAIFYAERNHVRYHIVNGHEVVDAKHSSNINSMADSFWWTFVTSTTVGYGDYYPVSFTGRFIGVLLMFLGISLVGIITGKIASVLVERQLKEDRGLKNLKLKNHFIICGWKRDMGGVIHDIMLKNSQFLPSEIVLINTADPENVDSLRAHREFAQINYINGDYIDENVLNRANLKHAKRVLILADRTHDASVQEIDSRTVMAVITIKTISKTVYTCAELIDAKFEHYLTASNCDETVLSSDYNKMLIANAAAGNGISHVIGELLNVNADVSINTVEIPQKFIGLKYGELFSFFFSRDHSLLIGVLENSGNFYKRKTEAIREAQKTSDISMLVDNLKEVKTLEANQPVINPSHDYQLKKHSRAIIIEGRS